MLRIDPSSLPSTFHFPTISQGEVDLLRQIEDVIKIGRVSLIEPGFLHGAAGTAPVPVNSLFIDCTAVAAPRLSVTPIWQGDVIIPGLLQAPLVSLSASVAGFIEASFTTDDEKNALAVPMQFTDTPAHYPQVLLSNALNRLLWSQNEKVTGFLKTARLDPAARTRAIMADVSNQVREEASQIRDATIAAVENLQKLSADSEAEQGAGER